MPKGIPPAVATRLTSEIGKIVSSPDVTGHIAFSGVEFEVRSGNDLTEFIRNEQMKWGNLVKAAGVKAD